MMSEDEILWQCNETELLQMARSQGLPPLRRGLPKGELVAIVMGERDPLPEQVAQTAYTRAKLEAFINHPDNWGRLMSQLPGCNGKCSTFHCTEGKHALCFYPNAGQVQ